MKQKIFQITSGKGPEECERAVSKVVEKILKDATAQNLDATLIESKKGNQRNTMLSALLLIKGVDVDTFSKQWEGSIQWISQSPYRKLHRRKNWFVGVTTHDITEQMKWSDKDVTYQTMRSSGPGGQNVNKVESAVRATHVPSGISVNSSNDRSQMINKKDATEKLRNKLLGWQIEKANEQVQDQWMEHNTLERGNPIKTFKESLQ